MYYNNSEYPTYKNPTQAFYNMPSTMLRPYTQPSYHHHHHTNQQAQPRSTQYNYQSSTTNYQSVNNGLNYAVPGHKSKPNLQQVSKPVEYQKSQAKPRSKTWDKIKSLTNTSKKTNKNCGHHYHDTTNDTSAYIPRYREEAETKYTNPYYCPQTYHIHPKHNQVDMIDSLYYRNGAQQNNNNIIPNRSSPISYPPSFNVSDMESPSHYPYKGVTIKNQTILLNSDYSYMSRQQQQADCYRPPTGDYSHQRQSRSKSTRTSRFHESDIVSSSSTTSSSMEQGTSETTQDESIYQTLGPSTSSANLPPSVSSAPAPPAPPPPAPPLNEDFFKTTATLPKFSLAKKARSATKLPEQMEKNFDDVMEELKSKLKLKNERQAALAANANKPSEMKPQINNNETKVNAPIVASFRNTNDFVPLYESTAADATSNLSEVMNKEEMSRNLTQADSNLSVLNEKYQTSESEKSKNNWLNSSMLSSPRAGFVDANTKIASVSSISSDSASSSTYSASLSSASTTSSSTGASSTQDIHRNKITVNAISSEYKLEIYKDFDDISEDYTKYTRQMLSPLPVLKPEADTQPVSTAEEAQDKTSEQERTITSSTSSKLHTLHYADKKNTITAFCTRNLFRDSRRIKSNFIRIAEPTSTTSDDATTARITTSLESEQSGLLLMMRGMKETSTHSLHDHRLSAYQDWPTVSKSQAKSSEELNVISELNKTNSIPSRFSSFTAYSPNKSTSLSDQPEYNILATRPQQPQRRQKVNKFVKISGNAYNNPGNRLKISEQPVLERTLKEIEQNRKINEYLVEMSSYYMEIQPPSQFRS